jgi:hypothetical protein
VGIVAELQPADHRIASATHWNIISVGAMSIQAK